MSARFEVCRGDSGWWARFRAANGRVVWVTETYTRRRAAERAVLVICGAQGFWATPVDRNLGRQYVRWVRELTEVREVDERVTP